jgi:hypothetical protein
MLTAFESMFLFMHDSPVEWEDELNRYFDFDHIQDRVSCEGWGHAERFERSNVHPAGPMHAREWTKYLYFHELASLNALVSEARRRYTGSPWARAQREERGSVPVAPTRGYRTAWTRRPSPWQGAKIFRAPPPRAIFILLRDVAPGHEDDASAYLDEILVPELLACPGFLRCERYEAGPALPGTPGSREFVSPPFLDIFDVASPEVLSSDAYLTRVLSLDRSPRGELVREHLTTRAQGVYLQRPSPWAVDTLDVDDVLRQK